MKRVALRSSPLDRPRSIGILALLGWTLCVTLPAGAAIRPEDRAHHGRPRLVAPAPDQHLVESTVRFAYELPPGYSRPVLVIAREAFDASTWTESPSSGAFVVREVDGAVPTLAELGLALEADATLWWTVGARENGRGALRFGPVRSFEAQRKFRNVVAPSPYLSPARTGRVELENAPARLATAPRIRLAAGYDFAPSIGEPVVPENLSSTRRDPDEIMPPDAMEAYIVQFAASPTTREFDAIAAAGGAVISYLPDQAYLVRMGPAARARLASTDGVAWVGEYRPAYRLSPLIDRASTGEAEYMTLAFPDADLAATRAAITATGAVVVSESNNGVNKLLRIRADRARLDAVAAISEVAWVEPVLRNELQNSSVQWVVQTNSNGNRRVWTMGIQGQNQVVMTSDSGLHPTHDQFRDASVALTGFGDYPTHRKVIAYKPGSTNPSVQFGDHAGASYHGTHTGGTITGNDDPNAASANDGVAKGAKLYFMDVSGTALANGVDPFSDLNDLFLPPYLGNAGGAARISSNSWGSAASGAYTLSSQQCDQFMWAHKDFFIAFSNGNSGPGGNTVGSPASAKNVSSIGGTQNALLPGIYSGSSRGPTDDGRRKPTFCTPGQGVTSSIGSANNAYGPLTGTSMSSPGAAGAVALLRQYLTDGWYPTGAAVPANGFAPSAALLKAMAINSATSVVSGFTAPDQNVGWGKMIIDSVLFFAGDSRKLLLVDQTEGLEAGQYVEYSIHVTDGLIPLEATLVWTDYPGNPAATTQIVNNLNLTVSQGASVYRGNVFTGAFSTTGGTYDVVNVEENVRINNPATGVWVIRIDATAVPVGPQPFALVITGGVSNGSGLLALDRAEYGTSSTVEIQVVDLNAGATVDVSLASLTETNPETVTLTGANGVYSGTLALSPATSGPGDAVLSVVNGDLISATYQDASPVVSLVTSATVNFDTPAISNVKAVGAGYGQARITWDTDRPGTSRVYYGTTPALELGSAFSPDAALTHEIVIGDLTPGVTYYYDVESASLTGAVARDDLGGAHYKHTAKNRGDILMVYGNGYFDRGIAWEDALAANGYDFDVWSGSLADEARLGGLSDGLRAYKAVLWQPAFDAYPAFTDPQADTITAYLAGGGRLAVSGHDIGWGLADPTSPSYSVARTAWLENTLKTIYLADPPTWTVNSGIGGDPISNAYTAGVNYVQLGTGAAGDEVSIAGASGGTGIYNWRNNDATPDNIGFRWESSTNNGSPGTALWGGQPTRLVNMFFEFTCMAPPYGSPSFIRNDILDKTIVWLLGRNRPLVTVTAPNGGETFTGATANVTWTESVDPGRAVGDRSIEYSLDGGSSWTVLATGVGPSPYSWDLTTMPNTAGARVRVRIADDGAPALTAQDASDADFTIDRSGGDLQGPVVVAGSIESDPNPITQSEAATLDAIVTDENTGGGTVAAAEWSFGASPAAAGAGTPMTGSFGASSVAVTVALDTNPFTEGMNSLWVRAQDAAGNWGPASSLTLQVNVPGQLDVGGAPKAAFLGQNAPNPFGGETRIAYGLPKRGRVQLGIFDLQGRLVRELVSGEVEAGQHDARWDGRDQRGAAVGAGVYYYRLLAEGVRIDRRMVVTN